MKINNINFNAADAAAAVKACNALGDVFPSLKMVQAGLILAALNPIFSDDQAVSILDTATSAGIGEGAYQSPPAFKTEYDAEGVRQIMFQTYWSNTSVLFQVVNRTLSIDIDFGVGGSSNRAQHVALELIRAIQSGVAQLTDVGGVVSPVEWGYCDHKIAVRNHALWANNSCDEFALIPALEKAFPPEVEPEIIPVVDGADELRSGDLDFTPKPN